MTRPEAINTKTTAGDSWVVQRKGRGGGRRRPSKPEVTATATVEVAPVVAQIPVTSAAESKVVKSASGTKSEAPAAKWQHGWGELSAAEMAGRITQLKEMGFSSSAARSALEACDWDVNRALDSLFTHNVPGHGTDVMSTSQEWENDALESSAYFDHQEQHKSSSSLASDSTSASSTSSPRQSLVTTPQQDSYDVETIQSMPPMPQLPPALPIIDPAIVMAAKPVVMATRPLAAPQVPAVPAVVAAPAVPAVKNICPVSVAPKRRLAKVEHTWVCDHQCAQTQLSVDEGTFVYIWSESRTVEGWIYAESLICSSRAGWLPASMLQQLPPTKRWMRVSKSCRAMYPTQLTVDIGNILLVDASQTPVGDGWVYADELASAMGHSIENPGNPGWVPIQCIMWAEV